MRPFVANGEAWRVVRVPAGDPRLVDRTLTERLAVTDPRRRCVFVRSDLTPPLLDKVLLHEIGHAITMSWGLLPRMRHEALRGDLIGLEEWAAQLIENHAIEAVVAASEALGRPVCVRGTCSGKLVEST